MKKKLSLFATKEAGLWGLLVLFFIVFFTVVLPAHSDMMIPDYERISVILVIGVGSSLLMLAYFLFNAVLAYCYHPAAPLSDEELPTCTVIVPAYNEGRHVSETLESLLASDYPQEKMEILAINDGSKDDTWHWIQSSAEAAGGRISTINLQRNGGKKNALYIGMKQSRAEIIITVDSDSCVPSNALRSLVSPFTQPDVGGVAGNIRVKNMEGGWIPRMLDTCFTFGFEFMRCAQSFIGSVFCTPGALSAYRRDAIAPYLDEWLNQTFMGEPSHIGEDRAITTLLLRGGYRVLFQQTAFAETCVPEDYSKLCRMLIRWNRSDIRENFAMSKFAYRDFPLFSLRRFGLQFNLTVQTLSTILPLIFVPLTIVTMAVCYRSLPELLALIAITTILWATIPAVIYARRYSLWTSIWVFAYALFAFVGLSWIAVYSLLTVRNSKWLTRELKVKTA